MLRVEDVTHWSLPPDTIPQHHKRDCCQLRELAPGMLAPCNSWGPTQRGQPRWGAAYKWVLLTVRSFSIHHTSWTPPHPTDAASLAGNPGPIDTVTPCLAGGSRVTMHFEGCAFLTSISISSNNSNSNNKTWRKPPRVLYTNMWRQGSGNQQNRFSLFFKSWEHSIYHHL